MGILPREHDHRRDAAGDLPDEERWTCFGLSLRPKGIEGCGDARPSFPIYVRIRKNEILKNMKDRIRKVMEWTGLSQQDFAARLDISPASLSGIFTGRTNPTNNHVVAIHRVFPQINVSWLLFGEGTMLEGEAAAGTEAAGNEQVVPGRGADVPAEINGMPSMFPESAFSGPVQHPSLVQKSPVMPHEGYVNRSNYAREMENAKAIDKPRRKIKEIRVFFDDGTYESFVPSGGK